MPTIIELVLDPVSLAVFAIYSGLMLWESLFPARALPMIRGWRVRGVIAFCIYFLLSSYLPLMWGGFLTQYQLFDLTALGTVGGALVGLLVYELGAYVWHRSMHASQFLWRGMHQMHHSAERLDTYSAFWFSPLDMVGWTALSSFCLTMIIGITPEAAVIVLYIVTFLAIFQHSNIRTPRWLGYLVQRPESHSHHHGKNQHRSNYADLPIFDLLFGTLYNPAQFSGETGFYEGASARVFDMLLFRDVSETENNINA